MILISCYKIYTFVRGGDVDNVSIKIEETDKFDESEIQDAIKMVKKTFQRKFTGCTLHSLEYSEEYQDETWKNMYSYDKVIVINSEFETGENGYEGGFNPKEGLIPRSLLRNKLMTNEVSLGLIPRSLLRGVSFRTRYIRVGHGY